MFKKKQKKGFTIVELVIVIAVIAILSAVLIPTFAGLIKKANVTADQTLVRNLNTSLAISSEGGTGKPTMYQTLEAMKEQGYSVEKLTPTSAGSEIVWDSEKNQFVLIMTDKNGNAEYYTGTEYTDYNGSDYYKLWKIFTSVEDVNANTTYSAYLAGSDKTGTVAVNGVGFDAGENAGINSVTYTNSSNNAKSVVIRTNSFDTVVAVDAYVGSSKNGDDVSVYGLIGECNVTKCANNSLHIYGMVAYLKMQQGRVVAENGGVVDTLYVAPSVENSVVAEKVGTGIIKNAYANSDVTNSGNVELSTTTADESTLKNTAKENSQNDAINNGVIKVEGVARIGTKGYETLAAAVAEATEKNMTQTIVLMKDTTITSTISVEQNANITIDFNGYWMICDNAADELLNAFDVDGTLTLRDNTNNGGIRFTTYFVPQKSPIAIGINSYGVLNFESGTIKDVYVGITNYYSGGTLNMTGGKIVSVSSADEIEACAVRFRRSGNMNLVAGEIDGSIYIENLKDGSSSVNYTLGDKLNYKAPKSFKSSGVTVTQNEDKIYVAEIV